MVSPRVIRLEEFCGSIAGTREIVHRIASRATRANRWRWFMYGAAVPPTAVGLINVCPFPKDVRDAFGMFVQSNVPAQGAEARVISLTASCTPRDAGEIRARSAPS